ncbi:MAG: hypothetical protein JWM95_3672, partial [Gemmatimonadetes bacterium]|nr:hypothetical protein [Gemmatimonadota bacterium]
MSGAFRTAVKHRWLAIARRVGVPPLSRAGVIKETSAVVLSRLLLRPSTIVVTCSDDEQPRFSEVVAGNGSIVNCRPLQKVCSGHRRALVRV